MCQQRESCKGGGTENKREARGGGGRGRLWLTVADYNCIDTFRVLLLYVDAIVLFYLL